jgi:hypothetical protein
VVVIPNPSATLRINSVRDLAKLHDHQIIATLAIGSIPMLRSG